MRDNLRAGLTVSNASISLSDALIEGNGVGVLKEFETSLEILDTTVRDNESDEEVCVTQCSVRVEETGSDTLNPW